MLSLQYVACVHYPRMCTTLPEVFPERMAERIHLGPRHIVHSTEVYGSQFYVSL